MKKNGNNIENFLIWEYLEIPKKLGWNNYENDWRIHWEKESKGRYGRYGVFIDFFDKIYNIIQSELLNKLCSEKKNNKILFFSGLKYENIIIEAKKNYLISLPVSAIRDRALAVTHFMGYFSIAGYMKLIYRYMSEREVKYLYRLIEIIKIKLEYLDPDFIILGNDCLPVERAVILASRKLKIPTIVIQHGLYDDKLPEIDGKVADYILAWGKYFKDFYIKNSFRKPNDVYILGYPFKINKNNPVSKENNNYIVCYLGQRWEKYDNNLFEIKIDTIKKLNDICVKLGINFIYRPHPGEDIELIKNKISRIQFTQKGEKLVNTIEKNDIFISFNSTALVEAFMHSKICLQLLNLPIKVSDFEKLGICNKTFKDIKELEKYLNIIADSNLKELNKFRKKFNNDYIDITHEPSRRFLEILEDIKKKK